MQTVRIVIKLFTRLFMLFKWGEIHLDGINTFTLIVTNLEALRVSKITKSARGEDCSLRVSPNCGDTETTVFCHLNSNYRGVGIKSPDLFGVYGCYECHLLLDASKVDYQDQLRALQETQMKLTNKGLLKCG